MIFAPMIPRAAYVHQPRRADVALQRFLMGALANPALEQAPARAAGCTVTHDDKTTTLALDVPGLARDQLQISIEGHTVSVQSVEGAPRKLHRAWELAQEVDASASRARLENGVLTLTLARLEPASKATRLTID
ncbi:MAG: Hsp20 family protein [Acidovorax sp.]|jgi:HSP20 family molecular chaperone IbpA|uniref:Hsp20/alpha crystallin family protein n=1 Tax=Acidovorax sp. TaxID=1872122 RepID=UPI002613B97A|nr:Hsp20 family protein [Acidovorax sp.]MDH4425683.1 Hsp20 family protein [Acidovorax sp.]